jgi:hypothetical protein
MKLSLAILSASSLGLAFPSVQKNLESRQQEGILQTVGNGAEGLLSNAGSDVKALLNSTLALSVDPANKRPEPGYEFQAPGPNDSRGIAFTQAYCIANNHYRTLSRFESSGQLRLPPS